MAMFSDIKVGDRIYSYKYGVFGKVREIDEGHAQAIIADLDNGKVIDFDYLGREFYEWQPTVFWDKPQFEIPEKPFNLKSEYKKLKRKEFVYGVNNYIIALKRDSDFDDVEVWYPRESSEIKMMGTCHYERDYIEKFTKLLNKNKVTFEQLEQVIKEVEDDD